MKEKNKEKEYSFVFAVLIAVLCTVLWGSAFPMIKKGYKLFQIRSDDASSMILFAGLRFLTAGIIVFLIGLIIPGQKRDMLLRKKDIIPVSILGLFQTFCQYFLLYIGVAHITGNRSALLSSVSTFASVIMSAIIFRTDKITIKKWLGCMIGLAGLAAANISDVENASFTFIGDGLVILSNISGAAGNVISKKISGGRRSEQISAWQLIIGGGSLTLGGLLTGGSFSQINIYGIGVLFYLAAMAGIAFMLWTMLLFRYPVSRIAVFNLMIPISGTIWSAILLGENILTFSNLLSLLLVCTGIFIVNASFSMSARRCVK